MASPFLSKRAPVCPPDLIERAAALPTPRVAIARAGAPLPMQAAKDAAEAGIMTPVLVGETKAIQDQAKALDWNISAYPIHHAEGEAASGDLAANLCGTGEADVLMKGQLHTDAFMKAALNREAGLRTGQRLFHIFHVTHPDGGAPLVISDAAVNVAPDLDTRKSALLGCVDLLHRLGNDRPKVAILSATESVIPSVPSAVDADELANWASEAVPNAEVAGPLALDLILSPEAVETKGLTGHPVAGQADAVIVPDIVSGNVLFKALVYLSGGCAGGLVMGAKVPILLTSRADPPAARLASAALAAIASAQ